MTIERHNFRPQTLCCAGGLPRCCAGGVTALVDVSNNRYRRIVVAGVHANTRCAVASTRRIYPGRRTTGIICSARWARNAVGVWEERLSHRALPIITPMTAPQHSTKLHNRLGILHFVGCPPLGTSGL